MKNTLLLLLLVAYLPAHAQFFANVVEVATYDLVYDENTDRIYVAIPSSSGPNGNSIGIINPNTYTLENTVFIGSEPAVLAITDNGQYIYAGFAGSATVRRFNVADQTAGLQFPLGSDPTTGSMYAEDIETLPGNPNAVAVSRMNNGFSPRHEGVAIYDDGVQRPITTQDHTGSNRIEFSSNNQIIGFNNETTEFGLRRLSVSAGGVNEVTVNSNVLSGFYVDFVYHNNFVYGTNGVAVDMSAQPFVAGQFNGAYGAPVYDEANDLVCYVSSNSGVMTFQRFSPTNFLLQDATPIFVSFGTAFKLITCGTDCYAFNTLDNKVVILKTVSSTEDEDGTGASAFQPSIFPNPTASSFQILPANTKLASAKIVGLDGKTWKSFDLDGSASACDVSDLPSGVYLVKMVDQRGNLAMTKLMKN